MECSPRGASAAVRRPVRAQLTNHQLAHRVIKIGRIVSPARRLLARAARILISLFAEQCFAARHAHSLRVHADRAQETYVSQERLAELADARLRRAVTETRFPHHLLGVMGPTFRVRVADEQSPEVEWRAVRVKELYEMPRPDFVG